MQNIDLKKLLKDVNLRANVIIEALPYIRQFYGKTIVVKYGGKAMESDLQIQDLLKDIVLMYFVGIKVILIHGGGKELTSWLEKLNIKSEFIDGHRKTTPEILQIAEMVLAGKINKELVAKINYFGGQAIGLSGKDGKLLIAEKLKNKDLGLVGEVVKVNVSLINLLCANNFIPVIASLGQSKDGKTTYNINADLVAKDIAISLKAEKLIFLTDVEGVKKNNKLISKITLQEANNLIKTKIVSEGMLPKIKSAMETVKKGVKAVHIISGKIPHSLLIELFTDKGMGTMVVK